MEAQPSALSEPSDQSLSPKRVPWWRAAGLALFAFGLWALIYDIERWNAIWYIPAWYGYLLVVDATLFMVQGHSFLSHRRRELGAMMFWSASFWYVFEFYNFVLENWYYVFTLHTAWIRFAFSLVAFATVLPACFVHAELLKALGWWRELAWRPLKVRPWMIHLMLALGALCIVLPIVIPRYAFWMVWGAGLWIPEVINYRTGAPSLLRDIEFGRPGRILRLLAGGAWAGLIWEAFNCWARCKWIYTVPGFEQWKAFEMPVFGFFGFPVLALEAFACYSMLCHFLRGGRHWEDQPARAGGPAGRRWASGLAAVLAIGFDLVVFQSSTAYAARSRRPILSDLDGLDASSVARLREAGIPTPERLHGRVVADGLFRLAERVDMPVESLSAAWRHAALSLHKGLGTTRARELQSLGIGRVSDLVSARAEDLWARLRERAAADGSAPPRISEVRVWIRAARRDGVPRR